MLKFFKKVVFSRSFMTALLIILQILFYVVVGSILAQYSYVIQVSAIILSALLAIYILGLKNGNVDVKLPWAILVLVFPVFGSLFYFLFKNQKVRKKVRLNIESQDYATKKILHSSDELYNSLKLKDKDIYNQSMYIYKTTNMPAYNNSVTQYFESGESYFDALIEELKKAERFIFMEYFIIRQGTMWNTVFNLLKEKVSHGVEVRIIYDDFGCINTLPQKYKKHLEKYGIKCEVFNPIYPITTLAHNNRDHRKIVVIDGLVAFTGGINLSDEYINKWKRFGHWKDTGILVKGDSVKSFTLMFLEAWHIYRDKNEDYLPYLPKIETIKNEYSLKKRKSKKNKKGEKKSKKKSYFEIAPTNNSRFTYDSNLENTGEIVQPYMSSPMESDEIVARNVYVNILNSAQNYVYITTPYLILDPELENALINAAKRCVDVRIITPRIPDKKYVYAVTRSEYYNLLKSGIIIYEYVPGFIHAKNVVADDKIATIGSINFDNRSFYHSYENGVFIYNSKTVIEMKEDFLNTQAVSEKIRLDFLDKASIFNKIKTSLFRLLIPLL